jgi:hypothetical protein
MTLLMTGLKFSKKGETNMKTKTSMGLATLLVGSALVFPAVLQAAEKDMMKDEKGMMEKGMKDDKGMMKDQKGMMKEGKDAMMKDKMKTDKSGKTAMPDDKMKMDDKKMEQKK